ncbi:MAG: M20/M25/M40 family metallo-hydrolase [Candidatus Aminicenantes bacterium]|nr:M20/M25/M40 family metallo-hydrolase [Candidatus Aminicenantes bacterium]
MDKKKLLQDVRQYRYAHEHEILKEFFDLLTIPNVSSDAENVRKNALFIRKMMEKRGINVRILETEGNPVIYGERMSSDSRQTLMFYIHYDGQPVDPSKWTDSSPFTPVLRPGKLRAGSSEPKPMPLPGAGEPIDEDWRIYARAASDDKAPISALLTALDALDRSGREVKNNLKFIFEGEEEAGSTHLLSCLKKHKDYLDADILFMCDGPVYFTGDPTLFFGVRGITSIQITVYGPNTSLHSGHFGNWAPNPANNLARLLASMKENSGRVTVKGFYDTVVPLSELEKEAIHNIPKCEEDLKKLYGFSGTEGSGKTYQETLQLPSLNINGINSGWVGDQARTIIPHQAVASLDIRLVKGNDPDDMVQKVIAHVKNQGYHLCDGEPDQKTRMAFPLLARVEVRENGYRASRTSMDLPICRRVIDSFSGYFEKNPLLLPTLGGSLPIYMFSDTLNIPIIGLPIVNHDNNQHQPDENLRIGHLWQGMETFAAIIMMEDR